MAQLDGKIAIVTAGGAGIGQATVWLLAERGAQVMAADIDPKGLAETVREAPTPERIRTVQADVTTLEGAEQTVRATTDAFGGELHILANVVGGSRPGYTVVDMAFEDWKRYFDLNIHSTFLMCKAAIPAMAASGGGSIVNISSGAGVRGMAKNPAYVAAKGAVVALTYSLAIDHADQHIRANCIAPGAILTPLMRRNRTPDEIAAFGKANLVGRLGDPRDIAATIAFLSSEDGAFVNGELINVSGGYRA
ncbi:MAG TPA: SDR family oxidoreductase [Chloroflexota bacterium]|nr:SDR family oxidoreductase [Chloroflexota bacterium]